MVRPSLWYSRVIASRRSFLLMMFVFLYSAMRDAYLMAFMMAPPESSYFWAMSWRFILGSSWDLGENDCCQSLRRSFGDGIGKCTIAWNRRVNASSILCLKLVARMTTPL